MTRPLARRWTRASGLADERRHRTGLARLDQPVTFLGALSRGFLGDRLRQALQAEGVGLAHAATVDVPTTLSLVGIDASGTASYAFYGHGCADRMLRPEHLPFLGEEVRALHFGS